MKDTKVFKTDPLPPGWKLSILKQCVSDAQTGFACGERDPNGVVQLRMNNVTTNGKFLWDQVLRVPTRTEIDKYYLKSGDVLFNNTNSTELVGKSACFISYKEQIVYSNHFTRIRTNNYLDSRLLTYWFIFLWNNKVFYNLCNVWIGQSAVKNDKLLSLEIPLPPIDEQKRIVEILDKKMELVEKLKQLVKKQLLHVKALRKAYLSQVFKTDPLPPGWKWVKLNDICDFEGGMQPPKSVFVFKPKEGYVRLVQIQDFRRNDVPVFIPYADAKKFFKEDDIMIGRYGPPVFQILKGLSGAYNVALMKTIPKGDLLKDFLYFLLKSPKIQKMVINESQRSAGQSGVQKEFLEKLFVPFPTIIIQKKIVEYLDKKMVLIEKLDNQLLELGKLIEAIPQSYLKLAFSGKLTQDFRENLKTQKQTESVTHG